MQDREECWCGVSTWNVLCNLRLEQPLVGSWANNWALLQPSTDLLPSPNPSIDLEEEELSEVKSLQLEWIWLVVPESMIMVGKEVAVCALYAQASGLLEEWIVVTQEISGEIDHWGHETFFKLYMMWVIIIAFTRLSFLQIWRWVRWSLLSGGIVLEPSTKPHISHVLNAFFIQTDQT